MTDKDGYVTGITKIVDAGAETLCWNLVILGDGYPDVDSSEKNQYHVDVAAFVNAFTNTWPFRGLLAGINIYRVDVVSYEVGADEPNLPPSPDAPQGCGNLGAGGPGPMPGTFFDATFCSVGPGNVRLDRLLTVNSELAKSVATCQMPFWHEILVLVNSKKYGGSGGPVAVSSTHPDWVYTAIHELGHTAFGLADEYGGDGTGTPPAEPSEPNVTFNGSRTGHKWSDFIHSATPMPTSCSPLPSTGSPDACTGNSTCVPPATHAPVGVIGAYEGAIYSNCNTYRSSPDCYMRSSRVFCKVCGDVIRRALQPYQPPAINPPSRPVEIYIRPDAWESETEWDADGPTYVANLPYYPPPNSTPEYSWVQGYRSGRFVFRFSLPSGSLGGRGYVNVLARMSSAEWFTPDLGPGYSDVFVLINGVSLGRIRVPGLLNQGTVWEWRNLPADAILPGGFENVIEFKVGDGDFVKGLTFHFEARRPGSVDSPIKISIFH